MRHQVIFSTFLSVGEDEKYLYTFVNSIRQRAGKFSDNPILIAVDSDKLSLISTQITQFLEINKVELLPVVLNHSYSHIPFFEKTISAGQTESHVRLITDKLIWMDIDSIILRFDELLLADKPILCRPVDIQNVGDLYGTPTNDFWEYIYQYCCVTDDQIFNLKTTIDQVNIKAYFNAGMLIVKPVNRILTMWCKNFKKIAPDITSFDFFKKEKIYSFFLHQAVLAGTILSSLTRHEIGILPHYINYPLHYHDRYPQEKQIKEIDELVSFRLDSYLDNHDFTELKGSEEIMIFLKRTLQILNRVE